MDDAQEEMVDRFNIRLPIEIPSTANLREHWAARAKRAASHRQAMISIPLTVRWMTPPLVITLTRLAPRRLDSDNLAISFKAVRDGIADRLGMDDGDPRLTWDYDQRREAVYGIEIDIETLVRPPDLP